jgi:probable addiction module antidote protein
MAVRTKRFDPTDYLTTNEALAEYVNAALETGDPAFIANSLGVVARAKGMAKVVRQAGLGRESLYKASMRSTIPRADLQVEYPLWPC